MKKLLAFDLDGTVFDDRHRKSLIDNSLVGEARWAAYHVASVNDVVFPIIQEHIEIGSKDREMTVQAWTARNELYREVTVHSIRNKVFPKSNPGFKVLMRPDNCALPSPVLKSRWLIDALEYEKYDEVHLFEDREDVCAAYAQVLAQSIAMGMKVEGYIYLCKDGEVMETNIIDKEYVEERRKNMKSAIGSAFNTLSAYRDIPVDILTGAKSQPQSAADVLDQMAATFRERNAVYKDNYKVVGKVMGALFPNGIEITTEADHNFYHLFELLIVKLTRFTNSGLTHKDSIHDIAVYAAMLEPLVNDHQIKIK